MRTHSKCRRTKWERFLEFVFGIGTQERWDSLMAALEDLEAAVSANTVAVDKAVAKLGSVGTGVDPVKVQAAADQVLADAVRLDSASN